MRKKKAHIVPHASNRATVFHVNHEALLLDFVMQMLAGISRNKAKGILTHGCVKVDGRVQTQHDYALQPGNVVEVNRHSRTPGRDDARRCIVYEDNVLVVVDKPDGVLSMPVGHSSLNMKSMLDHHFALMGQRCTAHVVHRLDCRTTGLMIYAKDTETQQLFEHNWRELVTDRRYIAVVEGEMQRLNGHIESWLKDNDRTFVVKSSPVDNGGKFAITDWRLLQSGFGYSLIELKLATGRKNQIRVHMASVGHPVVGDFKYGAEHDPIKRMCLHAYKIDIIHPITQEQLHFETPIPTAFLRLVGV